MVRGGEVFFSSIETCSSTSSATQDYVLKLSPHHDGGLAPDPPPPSQRVQAPGHTAPGTAGHSWHGVAPMNSPDPAGREKAEGL